MNVTSVKLLCWLSSASLAGGLFYYAYDFLTKIEEKKNPFNRDYVQSVLEENLEGPVEVKEGIGYDEVKRTFLYMNWTGKEEKKAVATTTEDTGPKKPQYKPVAELISLLMIQFDMVDPGGSRILVKYIGPGLADKGDAVLGVGDKLPKPHDYALVHAIRVDGVEFAFDVEGRPNETMTPDSPEEETLIVKVGPDGVRYPVRRELPKARPKVGQNPGETQRIGNDIWLLGDEDVQHFGANYAEILTSEVRTRTYRDKDGKRAGVEILDVKPGSIASRHGVQKGDIIISINGVGVSSEQEAIKFVKNNAEKYSVWEVVIENMGKRTTKVYKSPKD